MLSSLTPTQISSNSFIIKACIDSRLSIASKKRIERKRKKSIRSCVSSHRRPTANHHHPSLSSSSSSSAKCFAPLIVVYLNILSYFPHNHRSALRSRVSTFFNTNKRLFDYIWLKINSPLRCCLFLFVFVSFFHIRFTLIDVENAKRSVLYTKWYCLYEAFYQYKYSCTQTHIDSYTEREREREREVNAERLYSYTIWIRARRQAPEEICLYMCL